MKKPPGLDENFESWSTAQRVSIVYKSLYVTSLSIFLIGILFVISIGKNFQPYIWYWFAAVTVLILSRLVLAFIYQTKVNTFSPNGWSASFFLLSVLMSLLWGGVSYFYFISETEAEKMLIFMLLGGVMAAAMAVLAASPRTFMAYIITIYVSLSLAIILTHGDYNFYLFGGLTSFVIVMVVAGYRSHLNIMSTLYFQYSNQLLVESLKEEIQQRKGTQLELESHQNELEVLVQKRTRQLQDSNEALISEISIRKKIEKKLKHQAYHDDLTALPNRLLLLDRLEHALDRAQRHKTQVSVLFVDLNGFKQINDNYGHSTGDFILKSVANRLTTTLREEDTISRFGGDEFIILVEQNVGHENTVLLSKKIADILSEPFVFEDQMLSIGCSIGISLYPDDGDEVSLLLERADVAMYRAKKEEEQCCRFFHSSLNKHW